MSKNVAVFVDVANIFYAAKAAGVDIDYVTLLKSATAGRDFVRAYAYTGLDPENENQRQFHNFLARNGYKVISKDIRKYGDGRIKANLDIELVVDMMRMARNLDIAVVVSGDGDFAPAIRAVQQMGVRVEVISFRGNTSSDLIEVADTFTDIAQIARVEKGGAGRSGRRVAAEGDLSMTEVPEKETEGAPRRRRGGRGRTEREEVPVAAATSALPANMIVLPGERLSRAPEDGLDEVTSAEDAGVVEMDELPAGADEVSEEAGGEGRRRRRRRGGRGRGRSQREVEGELPVAAAPGVDEEEDDDFEDLAPAQPPIHTFGSVWDTQLGVPSVPIASAGPVSSEEEDDFEDEPEIPEYLLAERRQRGQRGQRGRMGGGGRGRGAGYQAAVERERFGRAGAGSFGVRQPASPRQDRPRGPRPPGQRQGRPERPPREQRPYERQPAQASSGQPWSEVPPEIEELLRAELARQGSPPSRQGPAAPVAAGTPAAPVAAPTPEADVPPVENVVDEAAAPAAAKKPRVPRRRPAASDADAAATATPPEAAPPAEEAPEKPARTTRRRAPTKAESPAEEAEKPKRVTRARRSAASESAAADRAAAGDAASTDAAEEAKPVRRRRAKASETAEGGGSTEA